MRIAKLAVAGAAILLATAATTHRPAAADPAALVAARQASMKMSGAIMASLKGAIDRGDEVKPLTFAASTLAGWAKAAPGLFPEGSNVAPTRALPAVWSDSAGFKARADAYAAAAGKLVAAAQASDKAAFAAAWTEVRASCGGCHDNYKQP
jgi:cytochrome c556